MLPLSRITRTTWPMPSSTAPSRSSSGPCSSGGTSDGRSTRLMSTDEISFAVFSLPSRVAQAVDRVRSPFSVSFGVVLLPRRTFAIRLCSATAPAMSSSRER